MDEKTLEYMGKRVDEARRVKGNIETYNSKIRHLEHGTIRSIHAGSANDSFTTLSEIPELVNEMREACLAILIKHRDYLQKQLDEI